MRQSRDEHFAAMKARRDALILDTAIELAKVDGYQWITRQAIAEIAKISVGSVNNAYGTMVELKRAVMRAAVERGIVEIVAQGLAEGSSIARNAGPELRERAAALITS
jgi:AcrR family transcriptional regulator